MAMASRCRTLGGRLRRPLQRLALGKQQDLENSLAPLSRNVFTGAGSVPGLFLAGRLSRVGASASNKMVNAGVLRPWEEEQMGIKWFSGGASSSSKVLHATTNEEYDSFLQTASEKNHVAVVDFTATWCAPCRHIAPALDEMSKEFDDVMFIKVDIDEAELEDTVKAAQIRAVPTFTFHKAGKKVAEFTGADTSKLREIVALLRKA